MKRLIRFFERILARFAPGRARKRKRSVQYLLCLILVALPLLALPLAAQTAAPIQDNSFLIEEAYNQEPGVVQHIQTFSRATRGGDWAYTFTDEWPAPSLKHQLSYTLPVAQIDGAHGAGDIALNYRYQWIGDGDARLAVSPRLTVLLPTGNSRRGLGNGGVGWQVMLPASTVLSPSLVAHWNLGATVTPSSNTHAITAGQSFVWLANPRVNLLVETLWTRTSDRAGHESQFTVSPGLRWSYDLPHHLQVVPGIAFPITNPGGAKSLFLYLSFEHPFKQLRGAANVQ
jgi:hypothetical protein